MIQENFINSINFKIDFIDPYKNLFVIFNKRKEFSNLLKVSFEILEFDKKNPDMIYNKKINSTVRGITLLDALVFRNWLAFAKMIGDESYKLVTEQVFYSKFIEDKLKLKTN